MFEFVAPYWALLAPLPWLLRRLLPPRPSDDAALRVPTLDPFSPFLEHHGHGDGERRLRLIALWALWLALLTAAARPEHFGEPVSVPVTGRDLLLAVDISGSMNREDMVLAGQKATRLMVVKDVLEAFLARREGDRLGLILFGSGAYLQAPLTFDRATVNALLQALR